MVVPEPKPAEHHRQAARRASDAYAKALRSAQAAGESRESPRPGTPSPAAQAAVQPPPTAG